MYSTVDPTINFIPLECRAECDGRFGSRVYSARLPNGINSTGLLFDPRAIRPSGLWSSPAKRNKLDGRFGRRVIPFDCRAKKHRRLIRASSLFRSTANGIKSTDDSVVESIPLTERNKHDSRFDRRVYSARLPNGINSTGGVLALKLGEFRGGAGAYWGSAGRVASV